MYAPCSPISAMTLPIRPEPSADGSPRNPLGERPPEPPAMPSIDDLEVAETEMYRDLYEALPRRVARDLGVSLEEDATGVFLRARGFDHPFFNRVMRPPRADGALLARARDHFGGAGIHRWMLHLLPDQVEPLLGATSPGSAAGGRPIVKLRGWSKHLGRLQGAPSIAPGLEGPSSLRVEEVGDDPEVKGALAWARIVVQGFGMHPGFVSWMAALSGRPGWRLYLVFPPGGEGLHPMAAGALYHPRSHPDVAQLNFGATLPEARRRGAQRALLAHRWEEARVRGVRWLVSETDEDLPGRPNPSHRNLLHLGLPVRYVRANVGPDPEASAS